MLNFVCIGSQKAGTTWLHNQLKSHPGAWMPPIKELRFFTRRPDRVIRKRVRGLEKRLADENSNLDPAERKFCEIFLDIIKSNKYGDFEAYRELWTVADDRIAGELTPDYASLPAKWARQFSAEFPETKIILIVRNPSDRLWSAIQMNARNNNKPELLTDQAEFEARATRKGTRGVSFVSKAIKAWRKAAPDRFRVFFYDDLAADSGVFRTSVAEFIGLDPEGFGEDAYVRSNSYPSIPAPDAYRAWMADYFAEEYEQLAELLGGHAIKWRDKNLEMRKSLASAS